MLPPRLVEGYQGFRHTRFRRERENYARLAEKGQKPEILMIACVDSRVAPEVVFDADPGEMLVVRNVANLVPPYQPDGAYHGTSAAIEFAVRTLKVRHVIVCGHASCGGINVFRQNALKGMDTTGGDFVGQWMEIAAPAARLACEGVDPLQDQTAMEHAAIRQSVANLRTFPWLAEREQAGELELHGLHFAVFDGTLLVLDEAAGTFSPLEDAPVA